MSCGKVEKGKSANFLKLQYTQAIKVMSQYHPYEERRPNYT